MCGRLGGAGDSKTTPKSAVAGLMSPHIAFPFRFKGIVSYTIMLVHRRTGGFAAHIIVLLLCALYEVIFNIKASLTPGFWPETFINHEHQLQVTTGV